MCAQDEQRQFAIGKGFTEIESTQFQMLHNDSDIAVRVSKDDIDWMEDATVKPDSYVSNDTLLLRLECFFLTLYYIINNTNLCFVLVLFPQTYCLDILFVHWVSLKLLMHFKDLK